MKFINNKKAMEMSIVTSWLFIIISTIVVLIIIALIYSRSEMIVEAIQNIF